MDAGGNDFESHTSADSYQPTFWVERPEMVCDHPAAERSTGRVGIDVQASTG